MSIFIGSRYETVTEQTPVKKVGETRTKRFLHNRRVFSKDDVRGNFTLHTLKNGELLDQLAFEFYQDESLWWLIADVNGIFYQFRDLVPGMILTIPDEGILENING